MPKNTSGFTLIEMLLSIGIVAVLFLISAIVLINIIPRTNVTAATEILRAELRQQQLQAMTGKTDSGGSAAEFGILIESNQYTLFPGTTYSPLPSGSVTVSLPSTISLSTTFANSVIIFEQGTGEVLNYDANADRITISDTEGTQPVTIEINKYGIPTEL